MAKLLLELLTEEVPYSLQKQLEQDIAKYCDYYLKKLNIFQENTQTKIFSTPRRLTLLIENLPKNTSTNKTIHKGPRVDAPKKALDGFLNKLSNALGRPISLDECFKEADKNGEFYIYEELQETQSTSNKISDLFFCTLDSIKFKKSMRWEQGGIYWVRPIRNILALYEDENKTTHIDFEFASLKSKNKTFSHRFLGDSKPTTIASIDDYFSFLKDNYVILDPKERENIIRQKAEEIATQHKCNINNNPKLIEELSYITEYPVVLAGKIPTKYMGLPQEILVTILVNHQKHINLFKKADGSLSEHFVLVANLLATDGGEQIIAGNEKVVNAKLADGLFFYNEDLKKPLSYYQEKLKDQEFFEGLGSVYEKTQRVYKLMEVNGSKEELEEFKKICNLYKADLTTQMVTELPELQGIIGYYYAKKFGVDEDICQAIRYHINPLGSDNKFRGKDEYKDLSLALAAIDKLDTLIEFFKIGKIPTSSSDPFALRRTAFDLVRICCNYNIPTKQVYQSQDPLRKFILERLEVYLQEKNFTDDLIKFVIKQFKENNDINLYVIFHVIKKLNELFEQEEGIAFLNLSKRLSNILEDFAEFDIEANTQIDENLFQKREETELYNILKDILEEVAVRDMVSDPTRPLSTPEAKAVKFKGRTYNDLLQEDCKNKFISFAYDIAYEWQPPSSRNEKYLKNMHELKKSVDEMLNSVLIDDTDPKMKANRILLLKKAQALTQVFGDFSSLDATQFKKGYSTKINET